MVLAELEVFHSRPIAPTRRVALGHRHLPLHPSPGFGGILLGGVAAANVGALDPDLLTDLHVLVDQVERGSRIAQPRLRHRFQTDRIGLTGSRLRLLSQGERMVFDLDDRAAPAQYLLAAVYATADLPPADRRAVLATVRRGLRWRGGTGPALIAHLGGSGAGRDWSTVAGADPEGWAREVLGLAAGAVDRRRIQRRFREEARNAHPDHGGIPAEAAARLADLAEARRILLGSS